MRATVSKAGIDIERSHAAAAKCDSTAQQKPRPNLSRKVLTAAERDTLGQRDCLHGVSIDEEVLLRFSLKESAYKALHKYVNRYVQFAEAEVYPCGNRDGGTAEIKLLLNTHNDDASTNENSTGSKSVYKVEAHWRRLCIQLQPQPAAAIASDVQSDTDVNNMSLHVSEDAAAVVTAPNEEFHVFLTCSNVQKL